jgi:hypothetical protein
MEIGKLKDGKRVRYMARKFGGTGKIIETYRRANGMWVVVHDRKRNVAVTLRPSQISSI